MMRKKARNLEQQPKKKKDRVGRQLSGYDFCMR